MSTAPYGVRLLVGATVTAIEATVASVGLRVEEAPKDGNLRCTGMLEKIARSGGGHALLRDSLRLLHQTWGAQHSAYDAPLVGGMAVFLDAFARALAASGAVDDLPVVTAEIGARTGDTPEQTAVPLRGRGSGWQVDSR